MTKGELWDDVEAAHRELRRDVVAFSRDSLTEAQLLEVAVTMARRAVDLVDRVHRLRGAS
jgi:hypothetical protein